jgi:hypothetical protein
MAALAGADLGALDADCGDAVTIAAVADDAATLAVLLQPGANARLVTSRWGGTALIAAGAPLDHVNHLHWMALVGAVVLGDGGARHQRTVQALLQAGASIRLADRDGRMPLQLAQARGDTAMVAALLAAGAR